MLYSMLYYKCVVCKRPLKGIFSQLIGMGALCEKRSQGRRQFSLMQNTSNLGEILNSAKKLYPSLQFRQIDLEYTVPFNSITACCRLNTIRVNADKYVYILSEKEDNPGMSVINAIQYIIEQLPEQSEKPKERIFIEHSATQQGDNFSLYDKEFSPLKIKDLFKLLKTKKSVEK